ncbi:uncharacterized protein LOC118465968 [Anopheles albimanus]|uniref:uncharacterized protein LOC118465968 n=1 Tax=Anopheles albimanus TaxID=7167 RepID=UPI00163F78A5|nr:uncharacterized protein LOC118465968 [Anopheles albimanus]
MENENNTESVAQQLSKHRTLHITRGCPGNFILFAVTQPKAKLLGTQQQLIVITPALVENGAETSPGPLSWQSRRINGVLVRSILASSILCIVNRPSRPLSPHCCHSWSWLPRR